MELPEELTKTPGLMGICQNRGPFLGTLNNKCRIILGTQKGTIILKPSYGRYTFTNMVFKA